MPETAVDRARAVQTRAAAVQPLDKDAQVALSPLEIASQRFLRPAPPGAYRDPSGLAAEDANRLAFQ
jgi:hypothetical protein